MRRWPDGEGGSRLSGWGGCFKNSDVTSDISKTADPEMEDVGDIHKRGNREKASNRGLNRDAKNIVRWMMRRESGVLFWGEICLVLSSDEVCSIEGWLFLLCGWNLLMLMQSLLIWRQLVVVLCGFGGDAKTKKGEAKMCGSKVCC
jgi:hypothetical protein